MHLEVSSGKWRPSCLGLNVLSKTPTIFTKPQFIGFLLSNISRNIRFRESASVHPSRTLVFHCSPQATILFKLPGWPLWERSDVVWVGVTRLFIIIICPFAPYGLARGPITWQIWYQFKVLRDCICSCSYATPYSFVHLPHMGLSMGQTFVNSVTSGVQTLHNTYVWNCWTDFLCLKTYGIV